jgi:hypothetical protein
VGRKKQQFSFPATMQNAISERFVAQFHSSYIFITAHATLCKVQVLKTKLKNTVSLL